MKLASRGGEKTLDLVPPALGQLCLYPLDQGRSWYQLKYTLSVRWIAKESHYTTRGFLHDWIEELILREYRPRIRLSLVPFLIPRVFLCTTGLI